MGKVYHDIRLANPFLRPDWRHARVLKMVESIPPGRIRRTDDKWIRGYKQFLSLWKRGDHSRDKLMREMPGMYFAYLLYSQTHSDAEMRLIVEARLLAGVSCEEIADGCKTIPETIQWYEKIFFNVTDFLTHHDWILKQVLLPAMYQTHEPEVHDDDLLDTIADIAAAAPPRKRTMPIVHPHLDMTLKFFAYYGGPVLCDLMISGFRRGRPVRSVEDIPDYLNEQFMSHIARRSAQAAGQFEVNKYNVMELFSVHSRLIELQRSLGQEEGRHNEFEKHVFAMLSEIPWTVGDEGRKLYAGTPLGNLDTEAAEADEEELLLLGAGHSIETEKEIRETSFESRKEAGNDAKPE